MRKSDPTKALDYPTLSDETWVIWTANEFKWPDARRELYYLHATDRHPLADYALFTMHCDGAATFKSRNEALSFLMLHTRRRGRPYLGVNVTTIAELKQTCGFKEPTQ